MTDVAGSLTSAVRRYLIFQIGRLQPRGFESIAFRYRRQEVEAELSSLAVAEVLRKAENAEVSVHLLFPVSLPFNPTLPLNEWKADSRLRLLAAMIRAAWLDPGSYRSDPQRLFACHPHVQDARSLGHERMQTDPFHVIPAVGSFVYPGPQHATTIPVPADRLSPAGTTHNRAVIRFNAPPELIELSMLIAMLRTVHGLETLGCPPGECLVDITSGQNLHAGLLWSAFRYLGVCLSYMFAHDDRTASPRLSLLATDPILPNVPGPYSIHSVPLNVARFFTIPPRVRPVFQGGCANIPSLDLLQEWGPGGIDPLVERLRQILDEGAKAWAAIYYGVPLLIPYIDNSLTKEQAILECIRGLCNAAEDQARNSIAQENYDTPNELGEWCRTVRSMFIALHIHLGILRCLRAARRELGLPVSYDSSLSEQGIKLKLLWDLYRKVLRRLSDDEPSLLAEREQHALTKTLTKALNSGVVARDWVLLQRAFAASSAGDPASQQSCTQSPLSTSAPLSTLNRKWDSRRYRNILAHAGFENSIVEFRCRDREVYVRYTDAGLERAWTAMYYAMGRAPGDTKARGRDEPVRAGGKAKTTTGGNRFSSASHDARTQRQSQQRRDYTENPAWIAARLRDDPTATVNEKAAVLDQFRNRGLYGSLLYWAEVFGLDHGLEPDQVEAALTRRDASAENWVPDYNTVKLIEEANLALREGRDPLGLEQLVLAGTVKGSAGPKAVWIAVPGLRDFYARVSERLADTPRELRGKRVRFRLQIVTHPKTGQPTLTATDLQLLPQVRR